MTHHKYFNGAYWPSWSLTSLETLIEQPVNTPIGSNERVSNGSGKNDDKAKICISAKINSQTKIGVFRMTYFIFYPPEISISNPRKQKKYLCAID
ncbi:TPA: hypothetical protein ACGOZX_001313 [Streptococcus suis]